MTARSDPADSKETAVTSFLVAESDDGFGRAITEASVEAANLVFDVAENHIGDPATSELLARLAERVQNVVVVRAVEEWEAHAATLDEAPAA